MAMTEEMMMTEEARKARNEYLREWRKAHPEAVKKHRTSEREKLKRDKALLKKLLKEREQWLLTGERAVDAD